jgi:predicted O-methyltransferase YrrM
MHWGEEFLRVDLESVRANFAHHGLLDAQVKFLPGWFQDTLQTAPIAQIAVLRLDGDMYESTWLALEALYDRVAPGGFVIVDDYGAIQACRQAVEDFRARRGITAPIETIDWTGRFWRVPRNLDLWSGRMSSPAQALVNAARALVSHDRPAAEAAALAALAVEPNALPAHLLLSDLRLPGPDYRHHLAALHAAIAPRCYVEIGVGPGDSLALVRPGTRAIAIDPAPRIEQPIAWDQLSLVETTSDEFFAGPAAAMLEPDGFDLAFVDGSHLFEQVVEDFLNLERYAAPGAVIVMHDTLPLDSATATPDRITTFWSGDAWKAVAVLLELRPHLRIDTIATAPTGLTLVRDLRASAPVDPDAKARLVAKWREADFDSHLRLRRSQLAPVASESGSVDRLLRGRYRGDFVARFSDFRQWQSWSANNESAFDADCIADLVRQALANGIVLPGGKAASPASLDGTNIREQLFADGLNPRQRAVLAVLGDELRLGPDATILMVGANNLETELRKRHVASTDPRSAPAGGFDAVVMIEQFPGAPDLDAALRQAASRLGSPGGALVATFPFAWNEAADLVCGEVGPGLTLSPDANGTFLLPGWNILRRCRRSGFSRAEMLLVSSARHAILEGAIVGVFVLVARR